MIMDGARTPNLQHDKSVAKLPIRYASPPADPHTGHSMSLRPSYRRRQGRGGRLFIDRRGLKRPRSEDPEDERQASLLSPPYNPRDERAHDRAAYDIDSDEDTQVYYNDPYDDWNIQYRIALAQTSPRGRGGGSQQHDVTMQQKMLEEQQRRHQQQAAQAGANVARAALTAASG